MATKTKKKAKKRTAKKAAQASSAGRSIQIKDKLVFLKEPFTEAQVDRMFDKNKSFRDLATVAYRTLNKAGKRGIKAEVGNNIVTKTSLRVDVHQFALSASDMCKEVGDALKKKFPNVAKPYPHPATLMYWVYYLPFDARPLVDGATVDETTNPFAALLAGGNAEVNGAIMVLGSWLRLGSMKISSLGSVKLWQAFQQHYRKLRSHFPLLMTESVHAHVPPSSGQVAGFLLHSLECRVPVQAEPDEMDGKVVAFKPTRYFEATLVFNDAKGATPPEKTGAVWLGISKARKEIFLASAKQPGGALVNLKDPNVVSSITTDASFTSTGGARKGDTLLPISPRIPPGSKLPKEFASRKAAMRAKAAPSKNP